MKHSFKCPKCKEEMEFVKKDRTENAEEKTHFEREIFCCYTHNIWITVETPDAEEGKVINNPISQ
jgi:hypothetical protein